MPALAIPKPLALKPTTQKKDAYDLHLAHKLSFIKDLDFYKGTVLGNLPLQKFSRGFCVDPFPLDISEMIAAQHFGQFQDIALLLVVANETREVFMTQKEAFHVSIKQHLDTSPEKNHINVIYFDSHGPHTERQYTCSACSIEQLIAQTFFPKNLEFVIRWYCNLFL